MGRGPKAGTSSLTKKLYVSTHPWPRGWYNQALENPAVRVEIDGIVADSLAVPVDAEAFKRVTAEDTDELVMVLSCSGSEWWF